MQRPLIDADHAATTALCDAAREAMAPFASSVDSARHGNPSGSHALARQALRALDEAREVVAGCIGCRPDEVIFTSGGTESDNHAITGGMPPRPGRPICGAVEHPAVREPTTHLGGTTIPVDRLGRVDLDGLADLLADDANDSIVSVVSVMAANNELGTIDDLAGVAAVLANVAPHTPLHTDAVQAAPWLDLVDLTACADLVSVSAHKLGGPKGVGALAVRRGTHLAPLLLGGSQERGLRGGTHNVAGIVGFAAAFSARVQHRAEMAGRTSSLRDRLADTVLATIDGVTETVGPEVAVAHGLPRDRSHLLPGHCHLLITGVSSEELLLLLDQHGVSASAASSCASGAIGGSHVLTAIGVRTGAATASDVGVAPLRLSLGATSTEADVDALIAALFAATTRARECAA